AADRGHAPAVGEEKLEGHRLAQRERRLAGDVEAADAEVGHGQAMAPHRALHGLERKAVRASHRLDSMVRPGVVDDLDPDWRETVRAITSRACDQSLPRVLWIGRSLLSDAAGRRRSAMRRHGIGRRMGVSWTA